MLKNKLRGAMASSKEFKDFILEQLRELDDIACRYMMSEYVLYYKGIVFGGIYDDRLLIKRTQSNKRYGLSEVIPYKNSKPLYIVENLEDIDYLSQLVKDTYKDLK